MVYIKYCTAYGNTEINSDGECNTCWDSDNIITLAISKEIFNKLINKNYKKER